MKNMAFSRSTAAPEYQGGFVLVTATMLLIGLTIVVLSIMRTSLVEERMVGNSRDWNNAFQAAEAALRDAEQEVMGVKGRKISGKTGFQTDCSSTGLCLPNTCPSSSDCLPVWIKMSTLSTCWKKGGSACADNTAKSTSYGAETGVAVMPGFGTQPRYIIEAVESTAAPNSQKVTPGGGVSTTIMYRITAVGFGVNTSTRVMIQSTVRPPQ